MVVHGERNQFFNLLTPVNSGQQINRLNAERPGDEIQLDQVNPQRTVFDLGDGAARSIMPARELQPVGEYILRPTVFVALSGYWSRYEIALLHHLSTRHSNSLSGNMVSE